MSAWDLDSVARLTMDSLRGSHLLSEWEFRSVL